MPAAYWDTCCLLKLYCRESDSDDYLLRAEQAAEAPISSSFARTELFYAFQQKATRGETSGISADELFAQFELDVDAGHISLAPLSEDVLTEAREIAQLCYQSDPPIFLRSLNGIHLATARKLHCTELITCDQRMQAAAHRVGNLR
jgi:predicted nucleic acid-binding protein